MAEPPETCGCTATLPLAFPGEGQRFDRMQGHWLLARAGKRVLRPGGLTLTRRMLNALNISGHDRVIEFAPGPGHYGANGAAQESNGISRGGARCCGGEPT